MSEKTNILLVEDDLNFGMILKDQLEMLDYNIHWVTDGEEGIKAAMSENAQLILLDVMMPKKDGISMLKELRQLDTTTPVILLTAKSALPDKVQGFESGADDYLSKPFDLEELDWRIKALLKRSSSTGQNEIKQHQIGKYTFDPEIHQLSIDEKQFKLTARETAILQLMSNHINETLDRAAILNAVWGNDNYFNGRSLDVYISKLRKVLAVDPNVSIVNIHGKGFRLNIS